ncbi:lipocalin family protein [Winogradskyella marincola]|uniref:Lipocalin family protein n=1 Tax=Winogradskyella marincola TaxID=3037795 RepID=A0ABT6G2J5_9FLAO|nr:lipocalin family protein [Winogradskyella sp. YYF002]MDG4716190.1 lipocalin family protein [Winogradskyella sp. YYF002]
MKKLNLLLGILIGLAILSCSSNDNDSSPNEPTILGEWILVNQIYDGQNENLSDCELQETLTFNSNGTLISYYTDNEPCEFFTETQQYELNGTELKILFGQNSDFRFNILTLTATELSIENFYRDGETLDTNNRTTYEYEKVE